MVSNASESGGVVGLVTGWVERRPDAVAVSHSDGELTYRALADRARRLAEVLVAQGVRRGDRVIVRLPSGPDLVVALVAVLWTGAAYVALDAEDSSARQRTVMRDCGAAAIITELDTTRMAAMPGVLPMARPADDEPAYVCYTSGTTGSPKGVVVSHGAVRDLVTADDYVRLSTADRVALASNPAFDALTFELWGALCSGAGLVVLPRETLLVPERLATALRAHGVTVMFVTTSLFNQIAVTTPEAFASLRVVLFGGEAANPRRVRAVCARPPRRLLNVYGPTEATTFATWHLVHDVAPDARTIPIGLPIRGTRAHVLDELLCETPPGEVGELYLGGPGLAQGYLGQPGLTAQRFVPDPVGPGGGRLYRTGDLVHRRRDGSLDFHGRSDDQVKLRGFRVEPGEVEACLAAHPLVGAAAVTVWGTGGDDRRLAGYVTVTAAPEPDLPEVILAWLRRRLPEYAVPAAVVVLDRLPLTANGKVDRSGLPAPVRAGRSVPPRTELEAALAVLWEDLLGVEDVGVHDNFFHIGGHSLAAGRLRTLIRQALLVDLPMRALYERVTVAEQAQALRDRAGSAGELTAAAEAVRRKATVTRRP